MKKNAGWTISAVLAVIALWQTWRVEQLQFENKLATQANRIDESQIRELMFLVDSAKRDVESEKTRAYLAGFTQAQIQPNMSDIWHAGYDRGTQVAAEGARLEVYSEIKSE